MGLTDLFDPSRGDDLRRLKAEIADIGHNLKRVMDHLGIAYERNPLLEISADALRALEAGEDQRAVEITAEDRQIPLDQAAAHLSVIKPRLGLGELDA